MQGPRGLKVVVSREVLVDETRCGWPAVANAVHLDSVAPNTWWNQEPLPVPPPLPMMPDGGGMPGVGNNGVPPPLQPGPADGGNDAAPLPPPADAAGGDVMGGGEPAAADGAAGEHGRVPPVNGPVGPGAGDAAAGGAAAGG